MEKKGSMSLEDNFFGCAETPIWIPPTFDESMLQICRSCTLRLTAKIPGPGNVHFTPDGCTINENPTTTLTVNGIPHNLMSTLLYFPGVHRLFGQQVPSDAEIYSVFRNTRDPNIQIVFALPVQIGDGSTNRYFATLGTGITPKRPTFASLVSEDSDFLCYKGATIFGRSYDTPRSRTMCDPVRSVYTHYVCCTPANILLADYQRLYQLFFEDARKPPKPLADVTQARLVKLATLIQGIRIESSADGSTADGSIATSAMKCYRLNPEKDVVQNRVYVGGKHRPGDRTLADELANAAIDVHSPVKDASVQARDIERILGIVLGVTVAAIVCATIAVFLWNGTFRNYLNAQKLYNNPISASKLSMKLPSFPRICPEPK